ncbi:MAG: hypothetical protein FJ308_07745 [Planctomycetes bacterium]|nr:hypothetical protein [Planctomycetota bacterium]
MVSSANQFVVVQVPLPIQGIAVHPNKHKIAVWYREPQVRDSGIDLTQHSTKLAIIDLKNPQQRNEVELGLQPKQVCWVDGELAVIYPKLKKLEVYTEKDLSKVRVFPLPFQARQMVSRNQSLVLQSESDDIIGDDVVIFDTPSFNRLASPVPLLKSKIESVGISTNQGALRLNDRLQVVSSRSNEGIPILQQRVAESVRVDQERLPSSTNSGVRISSIDAGNIFQFGPVSPLNGYAPVVAYSEIVPFSDPPLVDVSLDFPTSPVDARKLFRYRESRFPFKMEASSVHLHANAIGGIAFGTGSVVAYTRNPLYPVKVSPMTWDQTQSSLLLNALQAQTILTHTVAGGVPPYSFELITDYPFSAVEPTTGDLRIENARARDQGLFALFQVARKSAADGKTLEEFVEGLYGRESLVRTLLSVGRHQVLVNIPIKLIAADSEGTEVVLQYALYDSIPVPVVEEELQRIFSDPILVSKKDNAIKKPGVSAPPIKLKALQSKLERLESELKILRAGANR